MSQLAEHQRRNLFAFALMFVPELIGVLSIKILSYVNLPGVRTASVFVVGLIAFAFLLGYLFHVAETFSWIHTFLGVAGVVGLIFFVWASLIIALVMHIRTSRELKAAGYKVGLFGVPARAFEPPTLPQ